MMESIRFDTLVRVLAARRPRRAALLLLAGLGLALADARETGVAKKKDEKEIRICVCGDANPSTCRTQKKEKTKAKKTLRRNAYAYPGRCQSGVSGCAGSLVGPPDPVGLTCAETCDANCDFCISTLPLGGTRCGSHVQPEVPDRPCSSPANCNEVFATCVARFTMRDTNVTTELSPGLATGLCSIVSDCVVVPLP